MRAHRLKDGQRLAVKALRAGARQTGFTTVEWNVAGNCLNPRNVEFWGRPTPQEARQGSNSITTVMDVRCRRCEPCRKARAALWRYRAQSEIAGAWRTWFGTLTLNPDRRVYIRARARADLARRAVEFESLDGEDQWREQVAVATAEVTRWLKRVRKESGAKLRYILVVEAHKSGDPHFHVLVHETRPDQQVGERTLRKQWRWGFSKFNLVTETGIARYVTKYLTKSVLARVRASLHYGQNDLRHRDDGPVNTLPHQTANQAKPVKVPTFNSYGDCTNGQISNLPISQPAEIVVGSRSGSGGLSNPDAGER